MYTVSQYLVSQYVVYSITVYSLQYLSKQTALLCFSFELLADDRRVAAPGPLHITGDGLCVIFNISLTNST